MTSTPEAAGLCLNGRATKTKAVYMCPGWTPLTFGQAGVSRVGCVCKHTPPRVLSGMASISYNIILLF